MKVSILILTFNEEALLPQCLEALTWCDDIVVLDSGSTDRTIEIAKRYGARILRRDFDDFARQRNYGLDFGALKHDWVLHLDADEIVPPEFVFALERLQPQPGIEAYRVPSKLILFGKWLRRAGMYPVYQVRLGSRSALRFVQHGHGQREDLPPEKVATFDEPYLHLNFAHGMAHWLAKHMRYARDEAELIVSARSKAEPVGDVFTSSGRRRRLKQVSEKIPPALRPLLRFIYMYLVRGGFLDGSVGLLYCLMLATYEGMIACFIYELRHRASVPPLDARPPQKDRECTLS